MALTLLAPLGLPLLTRAPSSLPAQSAPQESPFRAPALPELRARLLAELLAVARLALLRALPVLRARQLADLPAASPSASRLRVLLPSKLSKVTRLAPELELSTLGWRPPRLAPPELLAVPKLLARRTLALERALPALAWPTLGLVPLTMLAVLELLALGALVRLTWAWAALRRVLSEMLSVPGPLSPPMSSPLAPALAPQVPLASTLTTWPMSMPLLITPAP